MFGYYLKLSLRNIRHNAFFFCLMIITLAVGIGLLMANLAILKSMASDPIPEKSDRVYSVNMNTWPHGRTNPWHIHRYEDVMHLLQSDIPAYSTTHYRSRVFARAMDSDEIRRQLAMVRATTPDFFDITNAPFAYGGSWQDERAQQLVIGHELNQKLFGGGNNLGQSVDIEGKSFQVVGILKPWKLRPLFYHATEGSPFAKTDDIFAPLETALDHEWGNTARMSSSGSITSPSDTRYKDAFFLQYFVQLDTPEQKADFIQFIDNYSQGLKDAGRMGDVDVNNKLYNVSEWLEYNEVVDQRLVAFALATLLFLLVCIFNSSSLLLSRYHAGRSETGLRRAVGARKLDIFYQGSLESILVGLLCALLSLALGWVLLKLSLSFFPYLVVIAEMDAGLMIMGVALAVFTTFISSLYPLIRAATINLSADLH